MNHSKTGKASLTGVVDTIEKFLTGVDITGNKCFAGVIEISESPK
jgi:hypothetical protein